MSEIATAVGQAVDFLKRVPGTEVHPKQLVIQLGLPISDGTLGRKLRQKAAVTERGEQAQGCAMPGIHRRIVEVEEDGVIKRMAKFSWSDKQEVE